MRENSARISLFWAPVISRLSNVFAVFARSNVLLELVDIDIKHFDMNPEAMCVEIVKAFAVCKSLRELYVDVRNRESIGKRQSIVEALEGYRRISTYVTACGVKYLP